MAGCVPGPDLVHFVSSRGRFSAAGSVRRKSLLPGTLDYGFVTRSRCRHLTGRPSFVAGSKRHAFTALNIIDVRTLPDLVESSFTDSTSPVFEITSSRRGRSSRRTPGGGSLGNFGHTETGGTRPGASVS